MLDVAFFGGLGHFSAAHFEAVAAVHRIVEVFAAPASRRRGRMLLRRLPGVRAHPLERAARGAGVSYRYAGRDAKGVTGRLADLRPDVICVAGYPWLLPAEVFRQPPLGALNSHASVLPRHRGILPLFWIYYHDDRQTGVTVHRVTERADAGDIVCQDVYPLPRGFSVGRLNARNAEHGGRLLVAALDAIEAGAANATPQDETRASDAPPVAPGVAMVDYGWDVERVWHFLAGLFPRYIEPLVDSRGNAVHYAAVLGYERAAAAAAPGTVKRNAEGWALHCHGGIVGLGDHVEGAARSPKSAGHGEGSGGRVLDDA